MPLNSSLRAHLCQCLVHKLGSAITVQSPDFTVELCLRIAHNLEHCWGDLILRHQSSEPSMASVGVDHMETVLHPLAVTGRRGARHEERVHMQYLTFGLANVHTTVTEGQTMALP